MRDNNKLVSIVVPIYNGEKYIDRCVANLVNQTYKNIEIIMINDGSKDNTCELIKEKSKQYPNIKLVSKENSGVSSTRNLGISLAKGDYIYFFDVDDDIEKTTIEDNISKIGERDVDVIYFGFYYHILADNRIKETEISSDFEGNGHDFFKNAFVELMDKEILNSPWNKLYRREFLLENKIEFDTNLSIYEDILFNIKVLQKASYIMVNKKAYYHYIIQASGTALTRFHYNNYESVKKIHMAGKEYASIYENNQLVKDRYDKMFVEQVASYLKQIANNKDLDKKKQKELMEDIIKDDYFRGVINSANNLSRRKIFLKTFTNLGMTGMLKLMYNFTNK